MLDNGAPDGEDASQAARNWCPQSQSQQRTRTDCQGVKDGEFQGLASLESLDAIANERNAHRQSQQEKSRPGPAASESGE